MLKDLLETLDYFFLDNATGLTCGEVEVIADAYREVGRGGMADELIKWHADGDDEGDLHHPDYQEEETD